MYGTKKFDNIKFYKFAALKKLLFFNKVHIW